MAKNWTDDAAVLDAVTENMMSLLYKTPKYFLRMDQISRKLDMPILQMQILCLLREGSISMTEISNRLCIAKPNVTPLLEQMHQRGYIERSRSELDRRMVIASLLPLGEKMVNQIEEEVREQLKSWPTHYNLSEMKRFNKALTTVMEMGNDVVQHREEK